MNPRSAGGGALVVCTVTETLAVAVVPDAAVALDPETFTPAPGQGTLAVEAREDDTRGGRYRPLFVHRLRGGIDRDGTIVGWDQVVAGQSILEGSPFAGMIKNGVDPTMVEGASDLPYAVPNLRVSAHAEKVAVPVLWWRSVGPVSYTPSDAADERTSVDLRGVRVLYKQTI